MRSSHRINLLRSSACMIRWLDRERHLVECCINKLKHFRRIFSRFDKLDRSFLGFVHFVCALVWLR